MSVIRGSALTNYQPLVSELGGDGGKLLAAARISPDDAGAYDRFISLPNAMAALEETAIAVSAPDFGLRLARRQGIEILGPVGLAARSAATVADAFDILEKFMAAYCPAISVRVIDLPDPVRCRFEFEFLLTPAPPRAQALELSLGVTLRVLHHFLGCGYRPVAVHLPHAAMTAPSEYRRYFGCPPMFSEPVAGFTLRATDMQRSLPKDLLAHQTAVDYLTGTLADRRPDASRLARILIRQLLPTGAIGLGDIALHLGMHPKALQRRLRAEGATFTELVDHIRREAAERLLSDTELNLDHVSRQLGYAEQSVFTRSCKRWFGTTPSAYRLSRSGR